MTYSAELLAKAKELYPSNFILHKKLEGGNPEISHHLDPYPKITPEEVLAAMSLEELWAKAKNLMAKRELFDMWWRECLKADQLPRYEN